ncbi:MAG: hemerythrin domain-containing protein [Pseudomonadota bacterium]
MQELLENFHREHLAMQRLIDQFDREAELMRDPSLDPDYHNMLEIVRVFVGHTHKEHYKKEQQLHHVLRLSMPEVTPLLERLEANQLEQEELGSELAQLLEAACSGHLVPRPKLRALVEDFVTHLHKHIDDEESQIIDYAEQWVKGDVLSGLQAS